MRGCGQLLTLIIGLWVSVAHASAPWAPQWRTLIPTDQPAEAVHLVEFNNRPTLMVQEAGFIRFRHPQTGAVLAQVQTQAQAIALWSSGEQKAYALCGQDGLQLLQTGPEHIVTRTQIQREPCQDIATVQLGEVRLVAMVRNHVISLFRIDSEGAWQKEMDKAPPDGAAPLLAQSEHALIVGWAGGTELTEMSARGTMNIPTGGPVAAVAQGPTGWAWTLQDGTTFIPLSGRPSHVARPIQNLYSVTLDANTTPDILIQHTEGPPTALFAPPTQSALDIELGHRRPVAGDLDNDGCPELVIPMNTAISIYYGGCEKTLKAEGPLQTNAPTTPSTLFRLGHDIELNVHVNQPLRYQLAHPDVEIERFAARGGPLWLKVSPNGEMTYTPTTQDIGRWEITVLAWEPLGAVKRFPLVLKIHRTEADAENHAERRPLRRRSRTYSNTRLLNNRLTFALGGTLGFSEASNSWAFLGTDWVVSGSPHISIQLDNPESTGLWWSLAGETAPWFQYLTENMEMNHFLSTLTTIGWSANEKFQIGVFGQAGFFITAVGVRSRWFPIHHKKSNTRHGFEFRASWLPSNAGIAGYGALFYAVRLPKGL